MVEELPRGVGEASRSGIFGTLSQTSKVQLYQKQKMRLKMPSHGGGGTLISFGGKRTKTFLRNFSLNQRLRPRLPRSKIMCQCGNLRRTLENLVQQRIDKMETFWASFF